MARIVTISKYPPLQGGISTRTYWLAKALGQRNHTVHIVTDRVGIDPVYLIPDCENIPDLPNVVVHRPSGELPWTIPSIEQSALALLNEGLAVVENYGADVIEGSYLVPYGIVAWILSKTTGVPLVIRHGGSDIGKFIEADVWPELWREVLGDAAIIISDPEYEENLREFTKRVQLLPPYVPDPEAFNPEGRKEHEKPVLAIVGKANYHWQHKGWNRVIDIWSALGDDFDYLVVSQGRGYDNFRSYVEGRLPNSVTWQDFVAPWQMPDLLKQIDAIFCFERDLPIRSFSNIALEALWCGTRVITDSPGLIDRYQRYGVDVEGWKDLIFQVPANNSRNAAKMIESFQWQDGNRIHPQISMDLFKSYIEENEKCLERLYSA